MKAIASVEQEPMTKDRIDMTPYMRVMKDVSQGTILIRSQGRRMNELPDLANKETKSSMDHRDADRIWIPTAIETNLVSALLEWIPTTPVPSDRVMGHRRGNELRTMIGSIPLHPRTTGVTEMRKITTNRTPEMMDADF
jgi:hypothetical protein